MKGYLNRSRSVSLRLKLVLVTTAAVFFIASGISWHNYARVKEITLENAITGLAGKTRLVALRFRSAFELLKNDAFVISRTPPIKGIMRAKANGGFDPVDGNRLAIWEQRLQTIFKSIMEERLYYTQIRYIGVNQGGRELVRVNRTRSGLEVVQSHNLQAKGDEAYFKAGLNLSKGEVFYSDVTYNREQGKTDPNLTPTIRAVLPIFDAQDQVTGMIVINADYEHLLTKTIREIAPQNNTLIFNEAGDHLDWSKDEQNSKFVFNDAVEEAHHNLINVFLQSHRDESSLVIGSDIYYYVKLKIDPKNPHAFIGVVERLHKDHLFKDAYDLLNQTLLIAGVLIALAMMVTAIIAGRLTSPLKALSKTITTANSHKDVRNLPIEQKDEVGDLARAYQGLVSNHLEDQAKAQVVFDHASEGIVTINKHAIIESCNRAAETIFGYKREEMIGRHVKMLMPERQGIPHEQFLSQFIAKGKGTIYGEGREILAQRKSGQYFYLELTFSHIKLDQKDLFSGIIRDISQKKLFEEERDQLIASLQEANDQLQIIAYGDQLTGLYNRAKCQQDLDERICSESTGREFALVQIDLDNFKRVNDTMGHAAGDQLLKEIGHRLLQVKDSFPNFFPYRWGGDEFIAIIDLEDEFSIGNFCEELTDILSIPISIGKLTHQPSASLGIALFPDDARTLEDLMIFADLALYKTKAHGRDGYQLFDQSLKDRVDREALVETELRRALQERELVLFYQPQVDIETGTITGVEALIRWQHPSRGLVSPGEFIEIAEKVGLGPEIGRYVMDEATKAARKWTDQNINFGQLSINVSPAHLGRGTFLQDFFSFIEANNVDPQLFVVEILESYTIDDPNMDINNTLVALRDHGVSVELDDFGTGYASLSHLTALPLDGLKIDQSFVRKMKRGATENNIVSALITMSKSLGFRVVCEGVETEDQIAFLRAFDLCSIQGYYLSRPLPEDELFEWISNWQGEGTLASINRERFLKISEPQAVLKSMMSKQ